MSLTLTNLRSVVLYNAQLRSCRNHARAQNVATERIRAHKSPYTKNSVNINHEIMSAE